MESSSASEISQFPSFSIILETENLANADLEGLSASLKSLIDQDVPPTWANEVILIDSGDAPPGLLAQLCQRYPWIKVQPASLNTGYYNAKMLGAQRSTGEIIIYCDSDCTYEPHWIGTILTTFRSNPDIQIVAGETATRGKGPYGTAMALTYIFPQYSGETELTPTYQYFLNNVAFRRNLLLQYPIPTDLPLYRGNCVIHAYRLTQEGYTIWRQPQARATHAPPNGLTHFFWRFLLIGHDYYWQQQLTQFEPNSNHAPIYPADLTESARVLTVKGTQVKFRIFSSRINRMFQNKPQHLLYLPFAIPIALTSVFLIFVGYVITRINSQYLLKTYESLLGNT
ncbi:MAG: glycosyltransferase [Leptolyngbyaceae cyanobacterium]